MSTYVKIFDKEYPTNIFNSHFKYRGRYSIAYKDWLPDFFNECETFQPEEYYKQMVEMFPDFQNVYVSHIPSESEILEYIIDYYNIRPLDGATSVPEVENKYDIKVGGGYIYPDGMSDVEYHTTRIKETGFWPRFLPKPKDVREAYVWAWNELHYPESDVISVLQKHYNKILELNPQLKDINFDKNNIDAINKFLDGVMYNFPPADIQLYLDRIKADTNNDRFEKEFNKIGMECSDFKWVVSSETLQNVAEQILERNQSRTDNAKKNACNTRNEGSVSDIIKANSHNR